MMTDYDPVAEQYKRSKLQPWRADVESFTLLALEARRHAPRLSPEGGSVFGREVWATFMDHVPITFNERSK